MATVQREEAKASSKAPPSHEHEIGRVQLDILKLSGTSREDVRKWVEVAKTDYRDVLAAAEYPTELVSPSWGMGKDECTKIRAQDKEQYENWLGTT
jgi:hypothetical protein